MTIQQHFTFKKILEVVVGIILFGVIAGMRLAPPGIRDDSGEGYIVISLLFATGCGLLYYGLFDRKEPDNSMVHTAQK